MFENINPLAKSTAVAEILLMLTVAFVLGYLLRHILCLLKHRNAAIISSPVAPTVSVPEVKKPTKDDLKVVEGIGPAIEKLLNKEGIHTYWELADTPITKLTKILTAAGPLYLNHGEATWGEQATLLRDGKMDEFKKLTQSLIGGNKVS
jgi:predicted flap endonuclease-1-like 5' DNA nuclease